MTELDRASLDRILPSASGSPDWDDVLSRGGAHRSGRGRRVAVFVAAALVAAAVTASAVGTVRNLLLGTTTTNSRIAFTSFRDGGFGLFVMNADGSGQRRVARDAYGSWSPDGRRIAVVRFTRTQPFVSEIYVINADGHAWRLTPGPGNESSPAWSPDGRKIAFTRSITGRTDAGRPSFESDVYVIDADGSDERKLTADGSSLGPIWSPDGRRIAFAGKGGASLMNADGSGQRLLTRNAFAIAWSRNGRKIVFMRGVGRGRGGGPAKSYVFAINSDGSGVRRLTRMAQVNFSFPALSPDGRKIAFVHDRDGNFEVYVMNVDGSGRRNLTRNPAHDSAPAWSPDGKKIVFTTKRDGNFEVYVMNADGSGQRNLTNNAAPDRAPVWSPGLKTG